jgi:hypothetical protein
MERNIQKYTLSILDVTIDMDNPTYSPVTKLLLHSPKGVVAIVVSSPSQTCPGTTFDTAQQRRRSAARVSHPLWRLHFFAIHASAICTLPNSTTSPLPPSERSTHNVSRRPLHCLDTPGSPGHKPGEPESLVMLRSCET